MTEKKKKKQKTNIMSDRITHASTFSGIGASEIAAEMLGWENLFHCEINKFCREVLDYHFPNAASYEDITKTDFSEWRGKVTVLTGGFPCQPFSYAGKRKGTEDNRYLWPYMLHCIEQIRPTWFVGENVAGIASMAFPGKDVKVGEQADLFGEGDGYEIYERREKYVLSEICRNLEVSDILSKHLLFQLVPWVPPTDETEYLLSHIDLLKTPCSMDAWSESMTSKSESETSGTLGQEVMSGYVEKRWKGLLQTPKAVQMPPESPENLRARYNAKGYRNGTRYNSLSSQIMYDPAWKELLPTPMASDNPHSSAKVDSKGRRWTENAKMSHSQSLADLAIKNLLPTPTAGEGEKYTNTYNPNSQMGQSLSAMAGSGLLPTPRANKATDLNLNSQNLADRDHANLEEKIAKCMITCNSKIDGEIFRLSPLFTEEMMGFPLMWTAYPFLLTNGEKNR